MLVNFPRKFKRKEIELRPRDNPAKYKLKGAAGGRFQGERGLNRGRQKF